MWFGTEQGLNRFDGYNFVVYKFQPDNANSLNNNYILSIHEDSSGIFWIGTRGGGLNRFDPEIEQFTHYLIDPESIDSFGNFINVIFEDRSGELWIGTAGGGLKKFDRKSKRFTHFPVSTGDAGSLSHNTVNAVFEDYSGILWVGTDGGLKQFNREERRLSAAGLPAGRVLAIYEDKAGDLWIGTDNSFYKFESGTGEFIHYQVPGDAGNRTNANVIRRFYEDRSGTFWIGTDHGLHMFDRREKTYHSFYTDLNDPYSLSNNGIRIIKEDRSGALWIGVYSGGLNKLNRTGQTFKHYYSNPGNPDSRNNRSVFALYEDREGVLWIGTFGEGLNAFNRKTGESKNYRNDPQNPNSLSDDRIWAICEDRQGMLWIGTAGGGLNGLNRKTGEVIRFLHQSRNPRSLCNNSISTIIEDPEGILWIGTNGGLNKFDPQKKTFFRYQTKAGKPNTLVHNLIYILHRDREGMLWIGTEGGLSIFDPKSENFTSYPIKPRDPNSMIYHPIFSFCEDKEGALWFGTTGGLYKFVRGKGVVSFYSEKDGLPNDVINGILDDDQGNLWLSTNKGLSRFNPRTGKFNNYSEVDGIQSYEFSGGAYYKSRSGELFFGGISGFNAFFPDSVKDNPYTPPVVITDFKIFNQSVPVGRALKGKGGVILNKAIWAVDEVILSHKHHTCTFEFAGLNYIHSEKNEYAYMMEGIEESWYYVGGRRFVTYAHLAPGEYTFRVKASNNHGIWNEEGVSLKVRVLHPFWETRWFRISVFGLFVFLIFGGVRLRTRSILKRKRELEEIVARRTIDLRESEEKYRTVVERANSGIAIVQDDKIIFKNRQFTELLGYDERETLRQPLIRFVAPGKQSDFEERLVHSRNEERFIGNFETLLRHKDGRDIPVDVSYGSITYKNEPALLVFFHDICMQKMLEEERMKTAKLESTRILSGGIAHDFNNLMAVIIGNIELALAETTPGDDIHNALSNAVTAGMKTVELIRQFITLAEGGAPVKKREYIREIIRDVVLSVFQDSGVTCHLHLPGELWPVDCDVNQIRQSIESVVINAKQSMADDGTFEVKARNEELEADQVPTGKAGKYVCIFIKDNGIGIPERDLSKIFDPYFSTREDVTQKGRGLGLAVVHSIVKRHEGIIGVTSVVGQGTTVRICLPASKNTSAG